MKAQMSFFAKALIIVAASIAFVLIVVYMIQFRRSTIEEREISSFKMKTTNILQKLINDENCLAFVDNETPQKGVIDVHKLNSFVSKYNETEPECAKTLEFDYNIKVLQFSHESKTYPTSAIAKVCYMRECHRGYRCIWIRYRVCKEKVIPSISNEVSLPSKVWRFGVPQFSPEKAKLRELQISLPITLRYNETSAMEGVIYIYSVRGELEELYSLIESLCQKAISEPNTDTKFSSYLYFSHPVELVGDKLCMLDSCKKIVCPFPILFKKLGKGEHLLVFAYDSDSRSISIY